jgi:hypothetical protein
LYVGRHVHFYVSPQQQYGISVPSLRDMYTEKDLQELEQFFKGKDLPKEVEVVQSQKVVDVKKFIAGHLACARANVGKPTFASFYDRLVKLKEKIPA